VSKASSLRRNPDELITDGDTIDPGEVAPMQWFTIGPAALEKLKANTKQIRETIGKTDIASRVRSLDDQKLGAFLNDVLALVDEAEGILARVRTETPSRALPRPFPEPPR
jgi:hypothetical protein